MTRIDWMCILWVFGMVGAMCVFAWPSWEEPKIHIVKVKVQPVLIEGPKEVKR